MSQRVPTPEELAQRQADQQKRLERARHIGDAVPAQAGTIQKTFSELAGDWLSAFTEVGDGRFVRPAREPAAFEILEISAWKGASFSFTWGVSLPYVPALPSRGRVRFHRSLKGARLDLFSDSSYELLPGTVSHYFSPPDDRWLLRSELADLWEESGQLAEEFWQGTATTEGVVQVAEQQGRTPAHGTGPGIHNPPPEVVAALASAHLGDLAQAKAFLAGCRLREEDLAVVERAVERVLGEAG